MKRILSFTFLCSATFCLAQNSVNSSGGTGSGAGGSISYSVGQTFYQTKISGHSVAEGVQQPFEITNLGVSDYPQIKLEMVIYPNPTMADITLKMGDSDFKNLSYWIADQSGRKISHSKIKQKETLVPMQPYNSGVYVLVISDGETVIKSFKIIKK